MASLRICRVSSLAAVVLSILAALFSAEVAARPTDATALAGVVQNTVGSVVEGVEVLVVDKAFAPIPVATATSDRDGRFRVHGLPLGAYRIAALKDGYLTFVGHVDTRLQKWVHVVLNPMPRPGEAGGPTPPDSAAWAFRLPRRYALHDEGQEVEPAEPYAPPIETATTREALSLRVDQLFSMGAELGRETAPIREAHGTETRLRLATPLGERGTIDLHGYRESFDSTLDAVESAPDAASRESAALMLGFAYETGPEARLLVSAFYDERELSYAPSLGDATPAPLGAAIVEQGQRHWGYDANWTTRVQGTGRLEVGLGYRDATLRAPWRLAALDAGAGTGLPGGALAARSVGASGNYEVSPAADHTVKIDFRAGLLETTEPGAVAGGPATWTPAFHALAGMNVGLAARDTWNLAGPFSLVYGLGVRHAVTEYETSLIVPSLGGEWRSGELALRLVASYHGVAGSGGEAWAAAAANAPARPLGYEAELDVPLSGELQLTGGTRFTPVQFDYIGRAGRDANHDSPPLYLSDGRASVDESWVSLAHTARRLRTHLGLARGRVEGALAAMTPYDVPQDFLTSSAIDYGSGLLGVHVVDSGTDVMLVLQRLVQTPSEVAPGAVDSRQRAVEVRVTQDLLDMRSVGLWRVLVGFRRATLETDRGEPESKAGGRGALASLNQQVSAGLSVSF